MFDIGFELLFDGLVEVVVLVIGVLMVVVNLIDVYC